MIDNESTVQPRLFDKRGKSFNFPIRVQSASFYTALKSGELLKVKESASLADNSSPPGVSTDHPMLSSMIRQEKRCICHRRLENAEPYRVDPRRLSYPAQTPRGSKTQPPYATSGCCVPPPRQIVRGGQSVNSSPSPGPRASRSFFASAATPSIHIVVSSTLGAPSSHASHAANKRSNGVVSTM